jgi:hypothetical protein
MSLYRDLKEPAIFTGSVTTLRMHIKRLVVSFLCHHNTISSRQCRKAKTHFAVYKQKCEAANLSMNSRAIPDEEIASSLMYVRFTLFVSFVNIMITLLPLSQTTLDPSLVPKITQYTKTGLLEHIMELIVSEDEVGIFFLDFSLII